MQKNIARAEFLNADAVNSNGGGEGQCTNKQLEAE